MINLHLKQFKRLLQLSIYNPAYVPYKPGQNPLEVLPKFEEALADIKAQYRVLPFRHKISNPLGLESERETACPDYFDAWQINGLRPLSL